MANKIDLTGDVVQTQELVGVAALTPGELLAFAADGTMIAHGTAGGNAQVIFALPNDFVGKSIDDDIAISDNIQVGHFKAGEKINAFAPASEVIVIGDPMESDGLGNLQVHVPQAVDEAGVATFNVVPDAIVAYAAETITIGGARARVKVRAR